MQNEQGQTLVLIVMIMILALGVGITVSTRFISGLRSTVATDYSYRAVAVAEAAVENILLNDLATLEDFVDNGTCGSQCALQIDGADGVPANATVTLARVGGSSDPIYVALTQNDVVEVALSGYPDATELNVCWDDSEGNNPSVVGQHVYGTLGAYSVEPYAINTFGSSAVNGFTEATAGFGFSSCFTVAGQSDQLSLRLRSLYSDADVVVLPASGASMPSQGIQVTSVGIVADSVKTVTAVVSDNFVPAAFDFSLFSRSDVDDLTNVAVTL